jgi:hypothetical protein
MNEINRNQVMTEIRSLFRKDEPLTSRCFKVLDGMIAAGKIIIDHGEYPSWAVVQEPHDNS